jgi:membrane fusion protein, multidrug efflux system
MNLRSVEDQDLRSDDGEERLVPVPPQAEADPHRQKPQTEPPGNRDSRQREPAPRPRDRLAVLRAHPWRFAAVAVVVAAIAIAILIWWLHARHFESTDDAFIDTRTVTISPQVAGAIVEVPVTDNQMVDAGAVLVHIDDRDYRSSLDQANAQVEEAQAGVANYDAQLGAQQANIDQATKQSTQAQATLTFAQQQNDRYQTLAKTGSGSEQQAQQTASDLRQKQAAYEGAEAAVASAQKQVAVLKAQRQNAAGQLDQARAAQEQAQTNLARTVIAAPIDGRVTKLSAAQGAYAPVGTALMMFVPRDVWVTANFKETQLADMRPGQPVDIVADAYPGRTFQGHVDSIQGGSGTAFSLLPAENATGNYVKIVQRVPVKIVFDQPPDVLFGPGMSVTPSVKVR